MGAVQYYCGCKEKPIEEILFQEKLSREKTIDKSYATNQSKAKSLFSKDELKALENTATKLQKNWKAIKLKSQILGNRKSVRSKRDQVLKKYQQIIELININIEKHGKFISNQDLNNKMPRKIFDTYSKFYQKEPLNMKYSPANTYRIRRKSLFIFSEKFIYKGQWTPIGERDGFGVLLGNDFLVQGFWNKNNLYYGMKVYINGDYFIGQLSNYSANGDGKFYKQNSELVYEGNFRDDYFHGMGMVFLSNIEEALCYEIISRNIDFENDSKKADELKKDSLKLINNKVNNTTSENYNTDECTHKRIVYRGEFYKNTINGKGKLLIPNYIKYEGDFQDGKLNGVGKIQFLYDLDMIYKTNDNHSQNKNRESENNNENVEMKTDNQEKRNVKKDKLKLVKKNSIIIDFDEYTGQFINNTIYGSGIYVWKAGDYFEGTFINNLKEGWGTITFKDGVNFESCWSKDQPSNSIQVRDEEGESLPNNIYKLIIFDKDNFNSNKTYQNEDEIRYYYLPNQKKIFIPDIIFECPKLIK